MKPFESFLASELKQYIVYRQGIGYTDKNLKSQLLHLDRYLSEKNAVWDSLQPSFFLGFKKTITREPRTVNVTISRVRGFFQFLIRQGVIKENPLQDIPPHREMAYIPFVFSPQQAEQLLMAIEKKLRKTQEHFLTDLAIYLAIQLLARCGLRISEPTRVLTTHYRSEEGTIYIEKTKFKKDRLIPIPKSMMGEIKNYLAVRSSLIPDDQCPYLLAGQKQKALSGRQIYPIFHQAVKDIGLDQPRRVIGNTTFGSPIPHSLRHSFAINTLKHIKDAGKSPQAALPVLAAYMGHRKYRYTAVYLKVLDAQQRQGLVDFNISHHEDL